MAYMSTTRYTLAVRRYSRRGAIAAFLSAAATLLSGCLDRPAPRRSAVYRHPLPRAGITAANVLPDSALLTYPRAIPVFAMVREIPKVMDSVMCHCNCAATLKRRSLLACFESEGMAKDCDLCLEQGVRVYNLHRNGVSLEHIRTIIDAAFG